MSEGLQVRPPALGGLVMVLAVGVMFAGASLPVARATGLLFVGAVVVALVQVLAYGLTARWSSVPVYGMYLGGGPRLVGVEAAGLALEFRAIPVGGTVAVHPEEVDLWEAEDAPAHAMVMVELAAPLASLVLAVLLLGSGAIEAVGLVPVQAWALMFEPSTHGQDLLYAALHLTEQAPVVVLGTLAAKLGVAQLVANLMRILRAVGRAVGVDATDEVLLVLGLIQVVLTTWVLFGFVYALSLIVDS